MNGRPLRTLLLGLLLLGPLAGGCRPGARAPGTLIPASASGTENWSATFRDAADEAGIRYSLGHGKTPLSILETAQGGCAFADFNGDGRLDILLVGSPTCALYRNRGDGRFEDMTLAAGLGRKGRWMGCTVGDFDSDGRPDLLLTGYRCLALLRNVDGTRFEDVTRAAGLGTGLWTTSAAFCDFDGDGLLDLYVGAYVDYHIGRMDHCTLAGVLTACGPEIYQPERGRLYRNLGRGRFQDVTRASGLDRAAGKTWGVSVADYDADGRPDLYLANDQVAGNLFHNLGGFRFEEVGTLSGTAYDPAGRVQGGMGVDWGDYDGDGLPDLFVATYANQDKQLYRNQGDGSFRSVSQEVGLALPAHPYVTFGCGFFDANNDGRLDLLTTSGHIRDNVARFETTQSYAQPLQLFANLGGGRFEDVSARSGPAFARPMVGRGLAFGDYDDDGRVDALVVDLEGRARLLHNESSPAAGNWLTVRLDGGARNRAGIGARVTIEVAGTRQTRDITVARSVLSASDPRAHFGLGAARSVDRLTVRWPDGSVQQLTNLLPNRSVTVQRVHKPTGRVQ